MDAVLSELKQEGLFYGDNKKAREHEATLKEGAIADAETDEEDTKKSKKAKKEKKDKKEEKVTKKRKHSEVEASESEEIKEAKKSKKRSKKEWFYQKFQALSSNRISKNTCSLFIWKLLLFSN